MLSLLIDTSSNIPVVALNKGDKALIYKYLDSKKELSSNLFPTIIELLEDASISVKDLKFIAIGRGPGSYTGLRCSASAAKALSYGLDIPLIGFCSLKCFLPALNGSFLSIMDAKSGGVYVLEGIKNKNSILYKSDPLLLSLEEMKKYFLKDFYFASPHVEILKKKFALYNFPEEKYLDAYPDVNHLAKIIFLKMQNNNFNLSEKLNLLYLRQPSSLAL